MSVHQPDDSRRMRRVAMTIAALFFMATLGLSAGCKSGQPVSNGPGEAAPSYQELASAHNRRIEQLHTLYADGVVEIRWQDKNGNHYEQGNMELWMQLPRRTALRVEKLSLVRLWLGSDDQRYWLFDLTGDQKVLHVGKHNEVVKEDSGAFAVKPLALLDLMAMTPLPDSGHAAGGKSPRFPAVNYDQKLDAWVIEAAGGGGLLRMYFDRQSRLPKRVESVGEKGQASLVSTLDKYKPVDVQGISPLASPLMAHTIRVASTAASVMAPAVSSAHKASGEVSLFIDSATANADQKQLGHVFDLQQLIQSMRPDVIDGEIPRPPAAAAPH